MTVKENVNIKLLDISKYFLQLNCRSNRLNMTDYEYENELSTLISQSIGSLELKINEIIRYINKTK